MPDSPTGSMHGLKDLFGSAPGETEVPKPAPRPAPPPVNTQNSHDAPQRDLPEPMPGDEPKRGHGLSGGFGTEPALSRPAPSDRAADAPAIDAPNLAAMPTDQAMMEEAIARAAPAASKPVAAPSSASAVPLSCVVVARSGAEAARRTIQSLRLQTDAPSLELIVVTDGEALPVKSDGLAGTRTIELPTGATYGEMAAAGVAAASGDLVAILDDYAFPARDWAAAVMTHRHDNFAALGSALVNANPRSPHSWGNMLMEYGSWRDGLIGGEVDALPARNLVYRRDLLNATGQRLASLLDVDGALPAQLHADGHPFKLQDAARLSVLNPSTRSATYRARFAAGRLDGASWRKGLSMPKRISKATSAALGGWARYQRDKGRIFAGSDAAVNPKIQGGAVRFGMVAEGFGRAAGLLRGPGKAKATRERLTSSRLAMLNKVDRQQFGR